MDIDPESKNREIKKVAEQFLERLNKFWINTLSPSIGLIFIISSIFDLSHMPTMFQFDIIFPIFGVSIGLRWICRMMILDMLSSGMIQFKIQNLKVSENSDNSKKKDPPENPWG
jgi:hypothetical protein